MRAFRQAKPGPPGKHIAFTLMQTCIFWTTFLVLIPMLLVFIEQRIHLPPFTFPYQGSVAAIGFIVASATGLWSGVTMAWRGEGTPLPSHCPRKLVIAGPYRYVRNPMAVAGLTQGFFVGVFAGSWSTLLYVVAGFFIWNYFVRPLEEEDLRQRFGPEFEAYCAHVRCWIPRRPYRAIAGNEHDEHPQEYQD
jgi:protein-S-isoprenylcysteine O-methyltransferase Ste14